MSAPGPGYEQTNHILAVIVTGGVVVGILTCAGAFSLPITPAASAAVCVAGVGGVYFTARWFWRDR